VRPGLEPAVSIRPPLWSRVLLAAIAAVGGLILTGGIGISVARGHGTAVLVLAAFASLWLTMLIRSVRTAVFTTADGRLVVRNVGRTRTLDRSQVAEVRLPTGPADVLGGNVLRLVLTDGKVVRLEATSRWPVGAHRRIAAARGQDLREWLDHPG